MSNLLSSYSGVAGTAISTQFIRESQTLNFPSNRSGVLMMVGAGGSGASWCASSTSGSHVFCQGGNAGGTIFQRLRFLANTDYTFTIGAGGAAKICSSEINAGAGSNGGDTTLTSSAIPTITAKGGLGGAYFAKAWTTSVLHDKPFQTQTWGTNADIINPGGYGGKIDMQESIGASATRFCFATGGGAANLFGLDPEDVSGGSITLTNNLWVTNLGIATGGGGVGGRGGNVEYTRDAVYDNTGSVQLILTAGGGSGGKAADVSYSGYFDQINDVQYQDEGENGVWVPTTLLSMNGYGQVASETRSTAVAPEGAGGGGGASGSKWNLQVTHHGGIGSDFGGGGGTVTGNRNDVRTGGAQVGGGGAGTTGLNYGSSYATGVDVLSGYGGGDGLAVIFWLSDFGRVIQ